MACQTSTELLPDDRHFVDTVALSAELESLGGIGGLSVDGVGNLVMANFDRYVWRISPDGDVEVLAANFAAASGNTVLRNGDILQADFDRQTITRLRLADGALELFSDAGFDGPVGLEEGRDGEIYVANFSGGYIARVPAAGGPAEVFARYDGMNNPNSIVRHPSGDFYVADLRSPTLFRISAQGEVTEFVTLPGQANGHVTIADGALYVTQLMDHRIIRVELDGTFTTAAGTGDRGFDDSGDSPATVSYPNGIVADAGGRLVYFNSHRGVMRGGEHGDILLRRVRIER
jgi:sugar lactone lactonase YvrE